MNKWLLCSWIILVVAIANGRDYDVTYFGAVGDGVTLNTVAIQSAIDQAHKDGQGRVVIPEGIFLSGSIHLYSGVELHISEGAVLLGSYLHEHHDVAKSSYMRAIILATDQQNIAITGKGIIDGQGRKNGVLLDSMYHVGLLDSIRYNHVEKRPRFYMRSMLIVFVKCKGILIEDITLKDAASWVQHYDRCEDLTIDNITVDSDAFWNNDGIDISDCKNVRVTYCNINCADDGICLKSHYVDYVMDSVYISDCKVRSSASAVKFGTKSEGGFRNVLIKNIEVYDTYRSAIAIESVDGGILENIYIDSITAINTGNAIFIKLGHREEERKVGTLRNVVLKNINVQVPWGRPDIDYDMRGPSLPFFHNIFPASITGMPDYPVENLVLENITISYPGRGHKAMAYAPLHRLHAIPENAAEYPEFSMYGELPAWGLYIRHVRGLQMKNVKLSIEDADYRPAIVLDDVNDATFQKFSIEDNSDLPELYHIRSNNLLMDTKLHSIKLD